MPQCPALPILALATTCLIPACRITRDGVDVSLVRDYVVPAQQDTVYLEQAPAAGSATGAPAAVYGYSSRPGAGTYTVRPGDTLGGIAARHHISTAELCRANHLISTRPLLIGQKLTIPRPSTAPTTTKPRPIPTRGYYTVRRGDTIPIIARRLGVRIPLLIRANKLTRQQASKLTIGQRLRIPVQP